MKDKALRLALEALKKCASALAEELAAWDIDPPLHHVLEASNACGPAITAIKQALEQHEEEPVAWVDLLKEAQKIVDSKTVWRRFIDGTPLSNDIACWMADFAQQHSSPPKREPLTGHQLVQLWKDVNGDDSGGAERFARAIEAAHGIKENT